MKQDMIAAQLYTLRRFLQTPSDIKEALTKVRQIGYQAVQASGLGAIEDIELKDYVDELGLTICATHVSFDQLVHHLPKVIQTHKLWGCEYVGLGMLPQIYRTSREGYETFIREFSEIGRELEADGLHLVYHNHQIEFEQHQGITGMELLLNGASDDTYSLELDTYWVQAGGANPVEWINKATGRLKVIHLKDMAIWEAKAVYAEIGQGNFNWQAIIDACRASGVQWYIVEQDECLRDAFESLTMSRAYLQNFVQG